MILTSLWSVPEGAPSPALGCRVEFEIDGVRRELDAADVVEVRFENCGAVRKFPAWRGMRHYPGALWMVRLGRHVAFESLTERACLLELDRSAEVVAVSSQPMWIRWSDGPPHEHVPDYFARLADGTGVVIDVRPAHRIDEAARCQFDATAVLCARQGWRYVVYAPEGTTRDANFRFLSRYRHQSWATDMAESKLEGFSGSLREAASLMDDDGLGLSRCYALIWAGVLRADLDRPLSLRSRVDGGADA